MEFLRGFGALGGLAVLFLSLVFLLGLVFEIIKWLYKRKFRSGGIKRGDIVHNLTDGTKSTVTKASSLGDLMSKTTVNLPPKYSQKEMAFIENWYMEEGINQLKAAAGRECYILKDKPPVPGCKFVDVRHIPVNIKVRGNITLELVDKQVSRTVKLLLLNEWII